MTDQPDPARHAASSRAAGQFCRQGGGGRLAAGVATALLAAGAPGAPALAHAVLVSSHPAAGATVPPGAESVEMRFNSRVDALRSRVVLIRPDRSEQRLDVGGVSGDGLSGGIPGLAPGRYVLRWQVLAVDGHITRGDIPFTVAPAADASPGPTAGAAAAPHTATN